MEVEVEQVVVRMAVVAVGVHLASLLTSPRQVEGAGWWLR